MKNEMTMLCIIVLNFNTCTTLKITTYCIISPRKTLTQYISQFFEMLNLCIIFYVAL